MNGIRMPSREAVQAQLARRSLASFFRYSWTVLEPRTPLIWNWHLEAVCDHIQALLEGRIPQRNLLINVPPGSSKSRIVSVCATAWWWIDHPAYRFICSSGNPRTVTRDSLYCRQIITSSWYQNWFRPKWRLAGDQNAKGLYRNSENGFRQAVGAKAKVTGDRADALFMDDLLDAADAESKAEREAVVYWYDNAFANRVSDMNTSVRCMIGQRLHEGDPCGHVLKSGEWTSLIIPQEFELVKKDPKEVKSESVRRRLTPLGWDDPRKAEGELMDPVRFPAVELAKEKTRLGTRGYAAQHQQRPAPAEGAILKRAWFRWYKTPRDEQGEMLPPLARAKALGITRIVQGCDTALTEKATSDYTADLTFGEAPSRFYVLDLLKEKMESPAAKSAIKAMWAKWNATALVIEGGSSASGKATVQTIRMESTLPVIELPVMMDKVAGLNAVAPTVEAGVVYLPDDQPWAADLVESLCTFPSAIHDDDVDAFRIGLWYLVNGGGATGMLDWMRRQAEAAQAAAPAA